MNADMGPAEVRQDCTIDDAGKDLLRAAIQQISKTPRSVRGQMGARTYHRTRSVKLARTTALFFFLGLGVIL
jgi:hypothetical protein